MKLSRLLSLLCIGLAVGLFTYVARMGWETLPEKVASHFGMDGRADGWMSREGAIMSFVWLLVPFALWLPFLALLSFFLPIKGPDGAWSGERRRAVIWYFLEQSLWWPTLALLFWASQLFLMIEANRLSPPVLNNSLAFLGAGLFVLATVGLILWSLRGYRRLARAY